MRVILISLLGLLAANAQLAVTVTPIKFNSQKVIVPLVLRNNFNEKIDSARAAAFVFDEHGKVVGQATKWVIGGSLDRPGLAAGDTNAFNFVVASDKPFISTNLTAKVTFSRVILEGGKVADVTKSVQIENVSR